MASSPPAIHAFVLIAPPCRPSAPNCDAQNEGHAQVRLRRTVAIFKKDSILGCPSEYGVRPLRAVETPHVCVAGEARASRLSACAWAGSFKN